MITIEKQAGKTVKGKKGEASVTIDKSIDEVTPAEFDALLLPGGHSPDYLRGDNRFVTFTRDFVNSGKPVFAICHGPQLLISADVIRGRKLTAVKPIIIDVKNAGAEFYDQEVVVGHATATSASPERQMSTTVIMSARFISCWVMTPFCMPRSGPMRSGLSLPFTASP